MRITLETNIRTWSDAELATLTPEEIEAWVELECARKSVPLLPPAPGPEPAVDPLPTPTTAVHAVVVGGTPAIVTTDAALADSLVQTLATAKTAGTLLDVGMVQGSKFAGLERGGLSVVVKTVNSEAEAKTLQDQQGAKKRWDELSAEYRVAYRGQAEIRLEVDELVEAALKAVRTVEDAQALYDRYLAISDNQEIIAKAFLFDVDPIAWGLLFGP